MTDRRSFLASSLLGLASAFASTSTALAASGGGNDMARIAELVSPKLSLLTDSYNAQAKTLITPVYNVVGYGAKGDGVTDDTAAVQAAIDALPANGGVVYFPPGDYKITSTLIIPKAGVSFLGGGMWTTRLRWYATTGKMISVDGYYYFRLSDIALIGSDVVGDTNQVGVYLHNSVESRIERVLISGMGGRGVWADYGTWSLVVRDSRVEYNGREGIYVGPSANEVTCSGVHFYSNYLGLYIATGSGGAVTGCSFQSNTYEGLLIWGCQGINVAGCYFENNYPTTTGTSGKHLNVNGDAANHSTGITVSGGYFTGGQTGIWFYFSDDCAVLGGHFLNQSDYAIRGPGGATNGIVVISPYVSGAGLGAFQDGGTGNIFIGGTSQRGSLSKAAIGGGQTITKHLSATATLNFAAPTAVPGSADQTITVTGASLGNTVTVGAPVTVGANYLLTAFVSAANTVTVRWTQISGAAADPDGAGGTYRVDVWQH